MIVRGIKIPVASHRSFFKYFESFHALPTTTFPSTAALIAPETSEYSRSRPGVKHSAHACLPAIRRSFGTVALAQM